MTEKIITFNNDLWHSYPKTIIAFQSGPVVLETRYIRESKINEQDDKLSFHAVRYPFRVLPQKIMTFQSPKMGFSAFWGLNLTTKGRVFHSRKCSFQFFQSHNQFLQDIIK